MSQNGPKDRRLKTATKPTIIPFFLPMYPVVDDQWRLAHEIARTFPDPAKKRHLIFLSMIPNGKRPTVDQLETQLRNGFLAKLETVLALNNQGIKEMEITEMNQKNGLLTCLIRFTIKAL